MVSDSRSERLKQLALAGLAALLLAVGFIPLGGVELAPLAWVALVPFAAIVERAPWRRMLGLSYAAGVGFFLLGLSWLRWATVVGWLILCAYLGVYFLLVAMQVRLLRRWLRLPMTAALPVAWTTAEFVRSWLFTGLPWLQLGHTQHQWLPAVQIADVVGVYGVSFLVAAVNGLIFDALCAADLVKTCAASGRWGRVAWLAGGAAAMLGADLAYGWYRLGTARLRPGPTIAIVQANISQETKHADSMQAKRYCFYRHIDLSEEVADACGRPGDDQPLDLIVWPETTIPGDLNDPTDAWSKKMRRRLTDLARRCRCRLLVGAAFAPNVPQPDPAYNSALYIDRAAGAERPVGRYDKMHLVPFGEYVPLQGLLPFLRPLVPYRTGFTAGEQAAVFELGDARFGVFICFESAFPRLIAGNFGCEPRADFLVNLSNDGWFADSSELDQHLAIARFRAIENRVAIVRATNTGISAFIDPTGRIRSVLERNGRRKLMAGYLIDRVMLDDRRTIYARWGDVFAWANLAIGAVLAAIGLRRWRRG